MPIAGPDPMTLPAGPAMAARWNRELAAADALAAQPGSPVGRLRDADFATWAAQQLRMWGPGPRDGAALADVHAALDRLAAGEQFGKIALTIGEG